MVKLYLFYIVCKTGKTAYIRHRIKNKAIFHSEKKSMWIYAKWLKESVEIVKIMDIKIYQEKILT